MFLFSTYIATAVPVASAKRIALGVVKLLIRFASLTIDVDFTRLTAELFELDRTSTSAGGACSPDGQSPTEKRMRRPRCLQFCTLAQAHRLHAESSLRGRISRRLILLSMHAVDHLPRIPPPVFSSILYSTLQRSYVCACR